MPHPIPSDLLRPKGDPAPSVRRAPSVPSRGPLGRSFVASLSLHLGLASVAFALPFAVLRGKAEERTASLVEVRVAPRPEALEFAPLPPEPEHPLRTEELPDPVLRPLDVPERAWPERPPLEDIETVPAQFERLPLEPFSRPEPEPEPKPEARTDNPPEAPAEIAPEQAPEEPGVEAPSTAPVLIPALSPRPPYPRKAQRMGWQGDVVCRITVGRDGRVVRATVVRSSGRELLDDAAQEGVLAWRFEPAMQSGAAVERDVLMRVAFQLDV